MKFSVLIPAYNEEKYIERCLKSIPKHKNLEIIACDDCSTDRTYEILMRHRKKRKMTVIKNMKNCDRAGTMNTMLVWSSGDIILKLDADMEIITKDIFKKLEKIFKNPKVGGVAIYGHTKEIEKKQKGFARIEYLIYNMVNRFKDMTLPVSSIKDLMIHLDIHCFRKKLVTYIPKGIIHDDGYFAMEVLRQKYKIVKGEGIIINHLKPPMNWKQFLKVRKRGREGWKQLKKIYGLKW